MAGVISSKSDVMALQARSDSNLLQQSISDLIDTNTPMNEAQMDRTLGAAAAYQQAAGPRTGTYAINTYAQGDNARVVHEFHDYLEEDSNVAVAVAVIKALTSVIKRSEAATLMGLNDELKNACEALKQCDPTAISLAAGCELFMRYVTRTSALEMVDLSAAKERLIARGETFASISISARAKISELGSRFVREDSLLLVHGLSRVSLAILKKSAQSGIRFSVIVTEGRPDGTGGATAKVLEEAGIPCTIILDSGVGAVMERVDMVLVGAEGVVENGGIINKLGTYQIAVVAKALGKPFYVAAESYKFARLYPLNQRDVPVENKHVDFGPHLPKCTMVETPSRDYTPPEFITLLFTDLGVLTPSAVSDELIQLYL